jgi:hypothetical protein
VSSRQVTDVGLRELARHKTLTTLSFWDSPLSDVGLGELARLKNLTSLELVNAAVTDAGLYELRKALPKCQVKSWEWHGW